MVGKDTIILELSCCDSAKRIKETIAQQAEDEGLWFIAQTAAEAYLQQELRKLHDIIESEFGKI